MAQEIPTQGFVFWPVGTGDSTTIGIEDDVVMQVDLHNLECADEEGDPHLSIVDELVRSLPKRNKKPYLAVFALTHPDLDHCCGFAELLEKVTIGELWFTPRIFREYAGEMCDDAVAFRKEARRRRDRTIEVGGLPESGDRVRVFGYDELLQEEKFKGFPKDLLTVPGNTVTVVDGTDYEGRFATFVHAPFKDDCAGERNDTSLALQITLSDGTATGRALLLGDLCYPTIRKIFDMTKKKEYLWWDLLLTPHHCSKSVMYWQDEGEDEEKLKQDILVDLEKAAGPSAHIVASCEPIPAQNKSGDNPPHAKAKARYQERVDSGHFLCTQEHPGEDAPKPIVFRLGETEIEYVAPEDEAGSGKSVDRSQAVTGGVAAARGTAEPPRDRVGFGAEP